MRSFFRLIGDRLREKSAVRLAFRRERMRIKRFFYGLDFVHPTFYLAGAARISRDFQAGAYSFVNEGCRIGPRVKIGDYVMFAPRVVVTGSDHRFDIPGKPMIFSGRPEIAETVIESDVWVGCGSVIMSGVRIGRGSIIGANSVVTKDVPAYEIHGGVPARKIRDRFAEGSDRDIHDAMLAAPPSAGKFCSRIGS